MRKVIVCAFVSLDGVMQAPGGPEEDPTGGFKHGGWTFPYWDDTIGGFMGESFGAPFELLLGRRTYDIFAAHWPYIEKGGEDWPIAELFNGIAKHVATHRPDSLSWQNSKPLGKDVAAAVRSLKQGEGPSLLTQGSSELVQLLLENDLADELRLLSYPVLLGKGKRLFGEKAHAGAFKLTKSVGTPSGVVLSTYQRAGDVKTGSFQLKNPSKAELERRRSLR
jgi:dihydrofolate reductase